MSECRNLENVGQVEELLLMTEQMQDELDQKDQTILWIGEKFQSNPEIAGSPRNSFRASPCIDITFRSFFCKL